MVKHSSKFNAGMRQSIVAFISMIVLIIVASNINGELSFPWGSINNGYQMAMAALPMSTPTVEPIEPKTVYQSSFMPLIARSDSPVPLIQATQEMPIYQAIIAQEALSQEAIAQENTVVNEIPSPEPPQPTSIAQEEVANAQQNSTPPEEQGFVDPITTPAPQTQPVGEFIPHDANYIEDQVRSWEDYAGPSVWPDMEVPAPMGILSHPEDQVNVLLLGSDQREDDYGFRTDTIQLLTINPSQGTVRLTAFPRDLYVYIPGYTMERINTAFGWGGFDALANTIEYNFGVKPDYYVLINFSSFVDVIDSLGGITVKVGQDLCDHRDDFGEFCVSQSDYWMGGKTALWYVRSRYTTSDLDRGRRQQEVLEALFDQLISINGLARAPELYAIYKENVTTDLTFETMARFIPLAAHIAKTREIGRHSIGAEQVYDWVNYSGAMVLVPMRENVLEVMRQAVSEP